MTVHKAQRRALNAFNKSVRTLIENNRVPSIDFKAIELKTRQDAGDMKVAELKKQLKELHKLISPDPDFDGYVVPASSKKADLIDALVDATVLYHEMKPTTVDILRDVAEANGLEIPTEMWSCKTKAVTLATYMRKRGIHRNATVANPTGDY